MVGGKRLPVVPGEVRSATTPEEPSSLKVVGGKLDALLRDPVESTRVVAAAWLDERRDDSSSRASAPLDLDIVMVMDSMDGCSATYEQDVSIMVGG